MIYLPYPNKRYSGETFSSDGQGRRKAIGMEYRYKVNVKERKEEKKK